MSNHDKDITEKRLEEYSDVFADIINVLVLKDSETKIKPEDLEPATARGIYKADGGLYEQERDVAKYWRVAGTRIMLMGLENQTSLDDTMPVRAFSYNGADMRKQVKDQEDAYRYNAKERADAKRDGREPRLRQIPCLFPAVTIVLYFGADHWQKRNLKDVLTIPKGFESFVADYTLPVYEIQYLTDEQVEAFQSDFKFVAKMFTAVRKKREGKPVPKLQADECAHATATLELMKAVTGDDRFENAIKIAKEGGGHIEMFELFDYYQDKGKIEEKTQVILRGYQEMHLSIDDICTLVDLDKEAVVAIIQKNVPGNDEENAVV